MDNMEKNIDINTSELNESNLIFTKLEDEKEYEKLPSKKQRKDSILKINNNEEDNNQRTPEDISWHEIQSAFRSRKILTGSLSGIEKIENGSYIVVVYYKEIRIVIPISEMMIQLSEDLQSNYGDIEIRRTKIINNMLGCDIDFIVKGVDSKTHSAVASRKEAMLKKRQIFYGTEENSQDSKIQKDSIVESRVVAVSEKVVRVEVFGVECSVLPRELTWDWLGDARERFNIGDKILVKIMEISFGEKQEDIQIQASIKQAVDNTVLMNLKKCKLQGKYAGTITDIVKGTVFVRLQMGVNAIAHTCNDSRMPNKKDYVSFVVTKLDEERGVAIGIITKIIKQNL